jgi:hypothetical protein
MATAVSAAALADACIPSTDFFFKKKVCLDLNLGRTRVRIDIACTHPSVQ